MKQLSPFARARHAAGYTADKFALKMKVTRQMQYIWEAGQAMPNPDRIQAIAKLLKKTPEEVMDLISESGQVAVSAC